MIGEDCFSSCASKSSSYSGSSKASFAYWFVLYYSFLSFKVEVLAFTFCQAYFWAGLRGEVRGASGYYKISSNQSGYWFFPFLSFLPEISSKLTLFICLADLSARLGTLLLMTGNFTFFYSRSKPQNSLLGRAFFLFFLSLALLVLLLAAQSSKSNSSSQFLFIIQYNY